ncbi:quercetin 2,3-dioxygenase [alpha proteobacterium AAP81b]|nr:quercetin 2,3-dioxygenase [alpha proteobacterium AAP81b]
MMLVRRSDERGPTRIGWLDSKHSFSFGGYHDPRFMGFGPLRVINEDKVTPGAGFGTHSHRDMEIISYVLDGALEHKDSIGTGSIIRPGDVQRMSAGSGVAHSEYNASASDPVHFLQIWILPEAAGLPPGYEQKSFAAAEKQGRLRLVGARDGRDGAITIHRDVDLYAGLFDKGERAVHALSAGRLAWVQVARGTITLNGETLAAGDGAALRDIDTIEIAGEDAAGNAAEVLLFDMAA